MNNDQDTMKNAPQEVRDFFLALSEPPPWYSSQASLPGIRAFHANADLVLQAFAGGVLIEGFTTNISKSFVIAGGLTDQGVNRLKQNNRHVLEIFLPEGLERYGDGWKLSVRVRLVHAQVRKLLKDSDAWDTPAWGTPLSGAHIALASATFSAGLLKHATTLGAAFTPEERESFMLTWRYSCHLMGAPAPILYPKEQDALHLYKIGLTCEPPADMESIINAHALIKAIPLVAGVTDEKDQQTLLRRVYTVSRALIGDELADHLRYPRYSTLGVLTWMRLQNRWNHALAKLLPRRSASRRLNNFSYMMTVAAYEDAGLTYEMPDKLADRTDTSK